LTDMMITLFSNEQINEFHDYQLKKEAAADERQKTADIVNMLKKSISAEEIAKTLDIEIDYVQMLQSLMDTNTKAS